jgi:hypothetical protein
MDSRRKAVASVIDAGESFRDSTRSPGFPAVAFSTGDASAPASNRPAWLASGCLAFGRLRRAASLNELGRSIPTATNWPRDLSTEHSGIRELMQMARSALSSRANPICDWLERPGEGASTATAGPSERGHSEPAATTGRQPSSRAIGLAKTGPSGVEPGPRWRHAGWASRPCWQR